MAEVYEVVDKEKTLELLIDTGEIEVPNLMSWNEWQVWRSTDGPHRRPRVRT